MTEIFNYLKAPFRAITFTVIGCGGTGSQVLRKLAIMAVAYGKLRNVKIHVIACDHDTVSEHNVGRQLFSHSEIGMNKAVCMINKINRTYGLAWEANTDKFSPAKSHEYVRWEYMSNFLITCVDNVETRKRMSEYLLYQNPITVNHMVIDNDVYTRNFFWVDIGNSKRSGQVIIGSPRTPSVMERYPNLSDDGDDTPSCSLAEALSKQDLFVNDFAATLACELIWDILTKYQLECAGVFFNLENFNIKKIPINAIETPDLRDKRKLKNRRYPGKRTQKCLDGVQ